MARKKPTPSPETKVDDVVLVHGSSEDGKTLAVLRKRGDQVSAGLLTAVEEGRPLTGDLLRLKPRKETPLVADVEVLYAHEAAASAEREGPARISSPAYREGWNAIFGSASRAPKSSRELN